MPLEDQPLVEKSRAATTIGHLRDYITSSVVSVLSKSKHNAPIAFGVMASISYGFWGFFEKFAAGGNALAVNAVVCTTAFVLSLPGLRRWRPPSVTALVAGFAGGGINIVVIYALAHHDLVLIFPFVSAGTIVFSLLSFFFLRGKFISRNRTQLLWGYLLTMVGLALCGVGLSGGIFALGWTPLDTASIALGLLLSLLTGVWIFLAFVTLAEHRYEPLIATTWVFLGSFLVALMALLLAQQTVVFEFSPAAASAMCAGAFMFLGEYCTYRAFSSVSLPHQRTDQTFIAILANSELVPVVLLSALILRERSYEGFLGAVLVLVGLTIFNRSRITQ